MKVLVKVGRKEGFVSSYNLFFANGLRLMTPDQTFAASSDRAEVKKQFDDVVAALIVGGFEVEGA
jgi:hypothetical protein